MEKLYINTLNDSKYVALITVLDYEISVNKYLKQLSFEASDYSLVIAPVVADLCTTPVALSAPPNSFHNNSQS